MSIGKKILFTVSGIALLMACVNSTVQAQRVSKVKAADFLQLCQKSQTVRACNIYISGIADSVAFSKVYAKNEGDPKAPAGFCIDPSVSGNEMRQKIIDYMKAHPDQLNQPAGATVFSALHESYPCKNESVGVR